MKILILNLCILLLLSGCRFDDRKENTVLTEYSEEAFESGDAEALQNPAEALQNAEEAAETEIKTEIETEIETETAESAKSETADARQTPAVYWNTVEAAKNYVHVYGAVKEPGVYELKENDRVFQIIEAAGGFTEDASQEYVNLALPLEDGDKLWIPTRAEAGRLEKQNGQTAKNTIEKKKTAENQKTEQDAGESAAQGKKAENVTVHTNTPSAEAVDSRININTASLEELCSLKGIGESKAQAIIDYRTQAGGFTVIDDIKKVRGIGDGSFAKLKDLIKT